MELVTDEDISPNLKGGRPNNLLTRKNPSANLSGSSGDIHHRIAFIIN
jgi:hypothetical protein